MHYVRLTLPVMLLVSLSITSASPDTRVTGYIGSHKLSFEGRKIDDSAHFPIQGGADYLAVTEVYPDAPNTVRYVYDVLADGECIYERHHTSDGFGPTTYFISLKGIRVNAIRIKNKSTEHSVVTSSVWAVPRSRLESLLARDSFGILGLITGPSEQHDDLARLLADNLPNRPDLRITKGFSYEVPYAAHSPDVVRTHVEKCAKWAAKHDLRAMLGLVSWWGGTPLYVPDGLGGKFGDINYQQICYSPGVEVSESEELKKLLGDRYSRHYGLSTPNIWSNCPWLTMNSKTLNDYRFRRIDEAVAVFKQVCREDRSWIDNVYIENEPRYWDTECEAGNPNSDREVLWADFNPLVVSDAAGDGIDLDPSDGLSDEELAWLHRNVGEYNQDTVDAVRKAFADHGFGSTIPIYTHSLQHKNQFPGGKINHPASEWAYADGARTGLEGLWTHVSDFYRVREWGRWANVNREENDGQSIDLHLWDLRTAYMMGADLYNSYNWYAIGPQRFFDYVKEFLTQFPVVTLPPASAKHVDSLLIRFRTPMRLQAFTSIELPIRIDGGPIKGCARVSVSTGSGDIVNAAWTEIDMDNGLHSVIFDFSTPAEARWDEDASLRLSVVDDHGKPVNRDSAYFAQEPATDMKLSLDLRTQRALSLAVIARAER